MPLYEYRCQECGTHFERIQKFSDSPLQICEKCGGKLERLLSSPAIQFKGSGWYVTDYARKSPPEASSKPDKTETPSDGAGKREKPSTAKSESTASSKND